MSEIFTATAIHEIDGKYKIIETSSLNELKQDLTRTREQLEKCKESMKMMKELPIVMHNMQLDKQLTIAREALEFYKDAYGIPGSHAEDALAEIEKLNTPIPMGEEGKR